MNPVREKICPTLSNSEHFVLLKPFFWLTNYVKAYFDRYTLNDTILRSMNKEQVRSLSTTTLNVLSKQQFNAINLLMLDRLQVHTLSDKRIAELSREQFQDIQYRFSFSQFKKYENDPRIEKNIVSTRQLWAIIDHKPATLEAGAWIGLVARLQKSKDALTDHEYNKLLRKAMKALHDRKEVIEYITKHFSKDQTDKRIERMASINDKTIAGIIAACPRKIPEKVQEPIEKAKKVIQARFSNAHSVVFQPGLYNYTENSWSSFSQKKITRAGEKFTLELSKHTQEEVHLIALDKNPEAFVQVSSFSKGWKDSVRWVSYTIEPGNYMIAEVDPWNGQKTVIAECFSIKASASS